MPRRKSSSKEVVIPTTSLVASSVRYPGKTANIYRPRQQWQAECYRHYSICGEARFAAKFFGHAVSRAILYAAVAGPQGPERQESGPAVDLLTELFNGKDGQEQMLSSIGTHLTIAGECYLVGRSSGTKKDLWEVVSVMEIQLAGTTWQLKYDEGLPPVNLNEQDVVIRIWTPHPKQRLEADSPFRSLLPILSEIEHLTLHVFAQVRSRLAGAGILFLPQGMTFPPPPEVDGKPAEVANEAESFMLTLADAMMTPIGDQGSPAAVIPIITTVPDDMVDQPKLLTFWSELDSHAKELRQEAIQRFALGMDLPPEQVLGMGSNAGSGGGRSNGVSHWGAWQIEEATIKLHVEPMLGTIVNALTMGYLRPALAEGDPSIVAYDSSALRLRPDRSKEAFELYDRGQLSAKALLRETGFDPEDAPNEEERALWLTIKIASGSATPEQVQAAASALGVKLDVVPAITRSRESRPDPSLEDHPTRPRTPEGALLVASEALVLRALERAGNKIKARGSRPPNVPAHEVHCHVRANGTSTSLLEDAFGPSASQLLCGIYDAETLIPVLNSYCSTLLSEQSPHTRDRLIQWLGLARLT